jgi:glutamyl-tRNA synthetase
MPTYHLANVVDDHLMRITHVVRATEWMPSTPKHLAIYEAFQWEPPAFAHVGLLVDSKAQKLSKRDSSASLQTFVEEGVFPEALTNYLALLGWSHQLKSDFLPMQALVQSFDLKFTKGNTVFDLKKLKYLQQLFARKYIEEGGPEFRGLIQSTCDMIHRHVDPSNLYVPSNHSLESYVAAILRADATHSSEPNAFLLRNLPFFEKDLVRDLPVNLEVKGLHQIVTKAIDKLSAIPQSDWSAPTLKAAIETLDLDKSQADSGRKLYASGDLETDEKARKTANAQISRVLRWAIMAGKPGPPMVSTMGILGRECTIERLQQAQSDV